MQVEEAKGGHHARVALQVFGQAFDGRGDENAYRAFKVFAGGFGEAGDLRCAAGEDDAAVEHFAQADAVQFFVDVGEVVLVTHGEQLDHVVAGELAVGQVAGAGQRDAVLLAVFVAQRPVTTFEGFGSGTRGTQGGGDFAGDLFAADGQGGGVHGLVVQPQHDVGGAGAEVNGANAEFAFIRTAGGVGGGESGIDDLFDFDAGFTHTLAEVVYGGAAGADDVDAGVEFVSGHAFGVGDAFVAIDDELLFEDVQQGLPAFVGEVARAHDSVDDVVVADAAVSDMGLAVAVDAEDVLA